MQQHEHSHYHFHSNERSTKIVVGISMLTMVLELFFGYRANSMAVLMDGWHMLSHVLVLTLAWFGYYYVRKNKARQQLNPHKVLALIGYSSALILLVITLLMLIETGEKFFHPEQNVQTDTILVAFIGLFVNGLNAFFLHREEEQADLSIRAAYLHVVSDMLISVLAIVSLFLSKYFQFYFADSIAGLFGAIVILRWAVALLVRSWNILLDEGKREEVC